MSELPDIPVAGTVALFLIGASRNPAFQPGSFPFWPIWHTTGKITGMSLAAFCAQKRSQILERLRDGLPPSEGYFEDRQWTDVKGKGHPQIGPTSYKPDSVTFEFLYPVPGKTALLFKVEIPTPERIVFLPVPTWVIESIWQGEIDGSFHFESDARLLINTYESEIAPEANLKWFEPREPRRRE